MKYEEFDEFFAYITSITTDPNPSPVKVQAYYEALADIPYDVLMAAAKKIIATQETPYLPMPAVFRRVAAEITSKQLPTAGEAWEEVLRAIRKYGGYREKEALESLSPLTRKAVQAVGWKALCYSEEPDIIRAQFRKAYEALEQREYTERKVPERLRGEIEQLAERLMIPEPKSNDPKRIERLKQITGR